MTHMHNRRCLWATTTKNMYKFRYALSRFCQLIDCGAVLDQKMDHVCSRNLSNARITYACTCMYAINICFSGQLSFVNCDQHFYDRSKCQVRLKYELINHLQRRQHGTRCVKKTAL